MSSAPARIHDPIVGVGVGRGAAIGPVVTVVEADLGAPRDAE